MIFPRWQNALLALLGAGLLILAFPDFEWWWTAWFALVPLMWAVEREGKAMPSFMLGWVFGTAYFFGTCWWLTYAPIHYAGVPVWLAYLLIIVACILTGLFPALFAAILSRLLGRFGSWAFLVAPFVWVFTEFARYWLTGNDWNAIGYSQAFSTLPIWRMDRIVQAIMPLASIGGVVCVSGVIALSNCVLLLSLRADRWIRFIPPATFLFAALAWTVFCVESPNTQRGEVDHALPSGASLIAIQPNVPMSGLDQSTWAKLRNDQTDRAEIGIQEEYRTRAKTRPILVVFPESPMNFAYDDDREFQQYVRDFTTKNNVSLLFNSAEPDRETGKYFNSAVMVGPDGKKVAEYDKIYLLPFGEAVPFPFEGLMPAVVGSFAYGKNYSLMPVGDAKAGVMICFESHFGSLSREYVKEGADVLIEMTNDGYLGPTPVLRQHLANAVFRAVETNRPVLRVTNVGITAYITETGQVLDAAPSYTEATRIWSVSKSDGSQTFYVKYGDWFAWLCTVVTVVMAVMSFRKKSLSAVSA
ncbi:MAG: apolipoprotein N-acyltransferase [Pyrinomonadaceae bacterium]